MIDKWWHLPQHPPPLVTLQNSSLSGHDVTLVPQSRLLSLCSVKAFIPPLHPFSGIEQWLYLVLCH